MTRPRKTPSAANDNAAADHAALVAAFCDPAFVQAFVAELVRNGFARGVGAELRRTMGSLQENATHVGFSESHFHKICKDGNGPPVLKLSNNCSRAKFADSDAAIEALSGKGE
jgi:AraC-like DNA-binding protein